MMPTLGLFQHFCSSIRSAATCYSRATPDLEDSRLCEQNRANMYVLPRLCHSVLGVPAQALLIPLTTP